MITHVRKRPFQPSNDQPTITSFFTRIDPTNPPPGFDPYDRKHVPSFAPPLADPVQSQLMNMGMRIRKSVPEGYKTHKTMPPSSAPNQPSSKHNLYSSSQTNPASSAPATLYQKPDELTPMCGLDKIGGYASQPLSLPTSTPELDNTQSTIASVTSQALSSVQPSTPSTTRKRSYSDEIEDELDSIFADEAEADRALELTHLPLPPKPKYPFSHSGMPHLSGKTGFVRPGSRPKARMKMRTITGVAPDLKDFEDEDVAFLVPMDCD